MKKICNFYNSNCKFKQSTIGFCKYCNNNFCNLHRLIEQHQCIYYTNIITYQKENLYKKLRKESEPNKKLYF